MPILYKYSKFLISSSSEEFDKIHRPGVPTPRSGVYRCTECGKEATSVHGYPLPPQNHHQHSTSAPIQWQLAVWG